MWNTPLQVSTAGNTFSLHCFQQLLPAADALEQLSPFHLCCCWQCSWSTGKCHCSGPYWLLFAASYLHDIVSPLDKEVWAVILGSDAGKQSSVSIERDCWEAVVNDTAPALIFFTWSWLGRASWRLCLHWHGVGTLQFQLWHLFSVPKDATLFPCWIKPCLSMCSASAWVWSGFRDNFMPN